MKDPKIKQVIGRGIPLPGDDVDTDRIIPAWFMKCVTFEHLGQYAFHSDRFNADGSRKDHPMNDPKFQGGSVLLVGKNFGCGSSREHAPQALMRYGIRAIVGESFAEIFSGNSTAIGIPLVTAAHDDIKKLADFVTGNPSKEVTVDLEARKASCGNVSFPIKQSEQTRKAFVEGTWDTTAELLSAKDEILALSERLPYVNGFAS